MFNVGSSGSNGGETMTTKKTEDEYTRQWITEKAQDILMEYSEGITLRQLHYRLVAAGMTNDTNHYKRVINAMTKARWQNVIDMDSFIDRERSMYGETEDDEKDISKEIDTAKLQVRLWMDNYHLNRWANQDNYVEVWIEKKALQGVFETPCHYAKVGLAPCKGYSSITFLHDASKRFQNAIDSNKNLIILYFGDYDPSGADIPRSIRANLCRMGIDVDMRHIALNLEQIHEMNLAGAPPKSTDSRTHNWDGGSVVECDAVEPRTLAKMCEEAIENNFDEQLHDELNKREGDERTAYRKALKEYVKTLGGEDDY